MSPRRMRRKDLAACGSAALALLLCACGGDLPGSTGTGYDLAWITDSGPGGDGVGPGGDGPKTDGPKTDGPKTDGPKTDGPKTDGPTQDAAPQDAGGDGTPVDAAPVDAPLSDTMPPDTVPPDSVPPDTVPPDTAPPPPLQSLVAGLYHEHQPPAALDLTTLVSGGAQPYTCAFYMGDGLGTLPSAMTLSGCKLTGDAAPDDFPGLYGVIVIVSDSSGQSVEIPIAMRIGSCNTAVGTIAPPEYPVRAISPPGSAYSWQWQITDLDALCQDAGCTSCSTCINTPVGTKSPLKLAGLLDCAQPGDVCQANSDIVDPTGCPSVTSWSSQMRVKQHAPLRSDGKPGWATLEIDATYAGTKTGTACGDKTWACHIEVLEH